MYWKTCPDCDGCGEDIPGEECACVKGDHPGLVPLARGNLIEIRDEAVQNGTRYLEVQFPEFDKATARILVRGVLLAAAGEKP